MQTEDRRARLVQKRVVDNVPVPHDLTEAQARGRRLFVSTAITDGEPAVFSEPGMVVLDAEGTMYWTSVSSMPFGRPPLDEVIAGLQLVQKNDHPVRGAA